MVHALWQCWRVVQSGGTLIDLRPIRSNPTMEVISANSILVPGSINDEGGAPDDIAADKALAETIRRKYFSLERQDSFEFAVYWKSLEDLLAYAEEKWRDIAYVPTAVVERARQRITDIDGPYQIRVRRKIQLGVYRRLPPS